LAAVTIAAGGTGSYEVNLVAGQRIDMRSLGTLRPAPGVEVVVRKR